MATIFDEAKTLYQIDPSQLARARCVIRDWMATNAGPRAAELFEIYTTAQVLESQYRQLLKFSINPDADLTPIQRSDLLGAKEQLAQAAVWLEAQGFGLKNQKEHLT